MLQSKLRGLRNIDESGNTSKNKEAEKTLKDFQNAWYKLLDIYSGDEPITDTKGNELLLNEDFPFGKLAMEDINISKWINTQIKLLKD